MTVTTLPLLLTVLFGVLSPFLTDLLTKAGAPQAVKSTVNVVLVAGSTTAAQFIVAPEWDWQGALVKFGIAWGASLAVHYSGATRPVERKTAGIGIGPKVDRSDIPDPVARDVRADVDDDESDAPNLAKPV